MGSQRIHYNWKFEITVTYVLAKHIQAVFIDLAILYTFSFMAQKAVIGVDSSIHYNENKSRNKESRARVSRLVRWQTWENGDGSRSSMNLNPTASSVSSPPQSRVDFLRLDPNANIVAGAVGGLFSLVVGHPFDTVKVRLQTMTMR